MKCRTCGAEIPQGLKYCTNCGTVLENGQNTANAGMNNQTNPNPSYNAYNQTPPGYTHGGAPMSIGGWIGRTLIPYIPFVGWLIYLIMLIVWTGDQTKDLSFRNWAKSRLVIIAIWLGISLVVFFFLLFTGVIAAFIGSASTGSFR